MPCISQFLGIAIYMYYNDHGVPHFHAEYGEFEAVYTIDTLEILRGRLPQQVHRRVVEWALTHREELSTNWARAQERLPLEQIEEL